MSHCACISISGVDATLSSWLNLIVSLQVQSYNTISHQLSIFNCHVQSILKRSFHVESSKTKNVLSLFVRVVSIHDHVLSGLINLIHGLACDGSHSKTIALSDAYLICRLPSIVQVEKSHIPIDQF